MTPQAIRDAIAASPDLQALAAAGNTQSIADALSVGRVRAVPTEVGNGTILEVLGMAKGNALIDLIASDTNFRHVKPLVEQGRLRLDSALVRGTLQSLVPGMLTQAEADALIAVGQVPDPITHTQVGEALKGA